jgi:hypothetical protein
VTTVSLPKNGQSREARERALETLTLMRAKGLSLSQAASKAGTTAKTVRKYATSGLRRTPRGYVARPSDRLVRQMALPTAEGKQTVRVKGSRDAYQVGEYWNAVSDFLQTGDTSKLREFEGRAIRDSRGETWQLVTDRRVLRRLGQAGVLSFEDIYEVTA